MIMPGTTELLIILAVVVLLFGAKRLPMIGDGLGKMITNFKKATTSKDPKLTEGEEENEPKDVTPDKTGTA